MSARTEIVQSIRTLLTDKTSAYAIADTLTSKKGVWTATKTSSDPELFEDAGNLGDYALLIVRSLERNAPVKVEVISQEHDLGGFLYTVKFKFKFVDVPATEPGLTDTIDDFTSEKLFAEITAALGGSTSNFSGTIRVVDEISDEQANAIATNYFRAVIRFCKTCSCTWRRLKNGAASIRIVAGDSREATA